MLLSGLQRSPGACPVSSHFTHFLCVIGVPPAAALGFAYSVSHAGSSGKNLAVFSVALTPTGFYRQR